MHANHFTYNAPFGPITISEKDGRICRVAIGEVSEDTPYAPSELTNRCSTELQEYFAGKRTCFDVPVRLEGSEFQRAVWDAASRIPYGQTRTPAEIAALIGRPNAYRLVSGAAAKNPVAIIVPAHRICPASGKEAGHGGATRAAKIRSAFRQLERKHS